MRERANKKTAHAIGYLAIEKERLVFVSAIAAAITVTAAMQGAGFALRRRQEKARAMTSAS